MNLSDRFWKTLEDKQDALGPPPEGLDLVWHIIRPPAGDKTKPAKELRRVARISSRHHPPALFSQPSVDMRPFVLVITAPQQDTIPSFQSLYEGYLDKNGYLAECLHLVKPHCDVPYVLFVGPETFFLYDLATEDILRSCGEFEDLAQLLIDPATRRENVRSQWDALARRSRSQRADEFAHWLDLWRVSIGARQASVSTPKLVQSICQKTILLFLFDLYFGFEDPDLSLKKWFLEIRQQRHGGKKISLAELQPSFDGIAWLHQASGELADLYGIEFLRWTEDERAFFLLMDNEARINFTQFIFELFLQSISKFEVPVQAEVFSNPDARLKMWKFSVTETVNVRQRLQADDVNVYAPFRIDLEESGLAWTLHVVGEILEYWREKCERLEQELATRNRVAVQFDMLQQVDFENLHIPTCDDLFRSILPQSIEIFYADEALRQTVEYLITLRIFEYCRNNGLAPQPLHNLEQIFVPKKPQSS